MFEPILRAWHAFWHAAAHNRTNIADALGDTVSVAEGRFEWLAMQPNLRITIADLQRWVNQVCVPLEGLLATNSGEERALCRRRPQGGNTRPAATDLADHPPVVAMTPSEKGATAQRGNDIDNGALLRTPAGEMSRKIARFAGLRAALQIVIDHKPWHDPSR